MNMKIPQQKVDLACYSEGESRERIGGVFALYCEVVKGVQDRYMPFFNKIYGFADCMFEKRLQRISTIGLLFLTVTNFQLQKQHASISNYYI